MTTKEQKAAVEHKQASCGMPVMAKPIRFTDRFLNTKKAYSIKDIAAERERWQLVLDARNEAIIGLRLSSGDLKNLLVLAQQECDTWRKEAGKADKNGYARAQKEFGKRYKGEGW